jgi:hypothetical protein
MFMFRRCGIPSLRLAAGLFLLWSLLAGTAWVLLAVKLLGYDTHTVTRHAGILSYFALFSAILPACIHYALLRRGSTLAMEKAAMFIAFTSSISALAIKKAQLQREGEMITTIYFHIDEPFVNRYQSMHDQGQYTELLPLLEQEFDRYDQQVASLGGMRAIIKRTGRPKYAFADGTSDLFGGLQMCIFYNAQFTPKNVEYFLMQAMHYDAGNTPKLQALAEQLTHSKQAVLKAYGLWMLRRYGAYRDFVYQRADQGEAWAYGFAAVATQHDHDPLRTLDVLVRYEQTLISELYDPSYFDLVDYPVVEAAHALERKTQSLSPRQSSLINRSLDRILHDEPRDESPKVTDLFRNMNRLADMQIYLALVHRSYDEMEDARLIRWLIDGKMAKKEFDAERLGRVNRVLDGYLSSGTYPKSYPAFTSGQIHRLFKLMDRGGDLKSHSR